MKLINPDGCPKCHIIGHAMFCGCPCHDGGPTIKEQLEAQGFELGAQGFELGAQLYSLDNGMTWERTPPVDTQLDACGTLTVVKIDYGRGEVTARVTYPQP